MQHYRIMLDLFMPREEDYYRILAIRTGPGDYAQRVIAQGWLDIGWCGTKDGLRLKAECTPSLMPDGKTKWTCHAENPTLPPAWASEQEFFKWIEKPYLHPKYRY